MGSSFWRPGERVGSAGAQPLAAVQLCYKFCFCPPSRLLGVPEGRGEEGPPEATWDARRALTLLPLCQIAIQALYCVFSQLLASALPGFPWLGTVGRSAPALPCASS